MKTLRSFMEDDEMDYTEAVEAAISKGKYLLNSLFDLEHFPTEDPASTEDDDLTYEPMKRKYSKRGTLNRGTDDALDKLAALNELCVSVLYPPRCPLLSLIAKKVNLKKTATQGQIYSLNQTTLSTQAAKTKRHHRQNREGPFTERVFTSLNEQIDEDTGVVFFLFQFMKPMITSM